MNSLRLISLLLIALALTSCSDLTTGAKGGLITKNSASKQGKNQPESTLKTYYGMASWYSIKTNYGRTTASGRLLSNHAHTAAHKKLPFGSRVRVTTLFNGKSEVLRITDRGPYTKGRIIDTTIGSAKRLGFHSRGITKVKVEVLSYGNWKYKKP